MPRPNRCRRTEQTAAKHRKVIRVKPRYRNFFIGSIIINNKIYCRNWKNYNLAKINQPTSDVLVLHTLSTHHLPSQEFSLHGSCDPRTRKDLCSMVVSGTTITLKLRDCPPSTKALQLSRQREEQSPKSCQC